MTADVTGILRETSLLRSAPDGDLHAIAAASRDAGDSWPTRRKGIGREAQ
jgi:hypothetical protein